MKFYLSAFGFTAVILAGCAKEGLDGEATLVVKPVHHETTIYSLAAYPDTVFIKFEAKDVPEDATNDYDHMVIGSVGEDHLHVEGLKWGYYSLYCTGWDTTGNPDVGRVKGGITIKIDRKDRKDETIVIVPVAE